MVTFASGRVKSLARIALARVGPPHRTVWYIVAVLVQRHGLALPCQALGLA